MLSDYDRELARRARAARMTDRCKCGGAITYQGFMSAECATPTCSNYRAPEMVHLSEPEPFAVGTWAWACHMADKGQKLECDGSGHGRPWTRLDPRSIMVGGRGRKVPWRIFTPVPTPAPLPQHGLYPWAGAIPGMPPSAPANPTPTPQQVPAPSTYPAGCIAWARDQARAGRVMRWGGSVCDPLTVLGAGGPIVTGWSLA